MSAIGNLDYASRPALRWRLYRRAFVIVAIAGMIAAGWLWGPGIWRWAKFLYWQHECLIYSKPPDHLVFDSQAIYLESAEALTQFEKLGGDSRYWQNATIFLHEMRSPDGSRWLVSLSCVGASGDFTVMQEARRPQSFINPSGAQYVWHQSDFRVDDGTPGLRVLAGQIDSSNPGHLTFEYEVGGQKHIMDGWLKDTGDLVVAARP
jgi:hypothetical protein